MFLLQKSCTNPHSRLSVCNSSVSPPPNAACRAALVSQDLCSPEGSVPAQGQLSDLMDDAPAENAGVLWVSRDLKGTPCTEQAAQNPRAAPARQQPGQGPTWPRRRPAPARWRCRSGPAPGGRSPSVGPGPSGTLVRTSPPAEESQPKSLHSQQQPAKRCCKDEETRASLL